MCDDPTSQLGSMSEHFNMTRLRLRYGSIPTYPIPEHVMLIIVIIHHNASTTYSTDPTVSASPPFHTLCHYYLPASGPGNDILLSFFTHSIPESHPHPHPVKNALSIQPPGYSFHLRDVFPPQR
jgi:hypothetical protein